MNFLQNRGTGAPGSLTSREYADFLQQQERAVERLNELDKEQIESKRRLQDAVSDIGFTFSSAFESAILSGEKLSDVLKGLARDIASVALRAAVIEPLLGGVRGLFQSSSTGGTGGLSLESLFPGKALGGPVAAGSPYLVGEKGPELMVPGTSGTIIPNNQLRGGDTVNLAVYALDSSSIYNYRQEIVAIIRDGFARRGNRVDLG